MLAMENREHPIEDSTGFDEPSKQVVKDAAKIYKLEVFNHPPVIGTDTLLKALLRNPDIQALIRRQNHTSGEISSALEEFGKLEENLRPEYGIRLTHDAIIALQMAQLYAELDGAEPIEPRHILQGIFDHSDNSAGRALSQAGIAPELFNRYHQRG
jgi:ATP-dependent Clp protease ATP-binding subunit ClpA